MKSLMMLWEKVALDYATGCGTSTTADIETCRRRLKNEGISFLAITLPELGKGFQKNLDLGYWATPSDHSGFHYDQGLPRFLGGFLELIFNRGDGVLLDEPSVEAILAVRQLTLMFSKISIPCSDARVRRAMLDYIECEQDVRENDYSRRPSDLEDFRRVASLLFSRAFSEMDRKVYNLEHTPRHGPGATADKLRGNAKFMQRTWPARLDKEFPVVEFLLPSPSYYERLDGIDILEPDAEIPVRVITVPKTLKTPRIIGIEPTAMQYAQQSLLPVVLDGIKTQRFLNAFLGFDDQTPNQRMAKEGSLDGSLATLDLSEASDRVSNQLVMELFRNHPHLLNAVMACRSTKADVPGHGVQHLAKFASMGSALCFPVEAMVFLTIIFVGIERGLNTHLTPEVLETYLRRVRVYGDDIIVPTDCVEHVVTALHAFGAKVGKHKSFWTGQFRESCGKEYYAGHDVSIVKVRELFPTQRGHVSEIISLVSLRNQLYYAGLWLAVKWLDDKIRGILTYFPVVESSSSVLGRESFLPYQGERTNGTLHRPEVRGWVVSAKIPRDPLDDTGALLKFFLKRGGQPSHDRRHLERAGRPQSVRIMLRWSTPY